MTIQDQRQGQVCDNECYVSIGTGKPDPWDAAEVRSRWWRLTHPLGKRAVDLLKKVATDSENQHRYFGHWVDMRRSHRGIQNISYHRFNCGNGLAHIDLDNYDKMQDIQELTQDYLASDDFRDELNRCLLALVPLL